MSELDKVNQSLQSGDIVNNVETASQVTQHSRKAIAEAMNRRGLLNRLFPDERQRAVMQGELELVKTEFESCKRFLQIVRETQVQSLTEMCNQYLVKEKATIRADVASFLFQKKQELQDEMDQIMEEFLERMEVKLEKLETLKNPKLKAVREEQLVRDIESFAELQQELVNRFHKIISEGV
jgi:hypothetical protein